MAVGLVFVSHSTRLAEGVLELASQMAQKNVAMAAAGGAFDGALGTSMERILAALHQVDGPDGILVLLDMGSAVMATEMAVENFVLEKHGRVIISSAPLVEGAVVAAVESSVGNSLEHVAEAAANAYLLPKVHEVHGQG